MASSSSCTTGSICWNKSRKVRIIAIIRHQLPHSFNASSPPWISVAKHTDDAGLTQKVTISFAHKKPTSFASGKYAFEMDDCYEENEELGVIYSREIKSLLCGVFGGQDASVIAYGARGSGKTYAIQGSEEKPGLATMAMAEILSMAEETGKLVRISLYEVFHAHVYDLLDHNHPEVQVFENAQGKIELKGLSQVAVKSISEFHKLYFSGGCNSWKGADKAGLKGTQRSHKGLIINILSHNENSNIKLVGKMNFVDLAGYEDARRSSRDSTNLGDSSKINKSLYALMNVIYALNANEIRVPYRENKLTRVLQGSFGGANRILMLMCLNSSFCQDTMHIVNLASRSFQANNRVTSSVKRSIKSSTKLAAASTVAGNDASSRLHLHKSKSSVIMNGRKLFDDGMSSTVPKQAKFSMYSVSTSLSDASSSVKSCSYKEEEKSIADASSLAFVPLEEEILLPTGQEDKLSSTVIDKEISTSLAHMTTQVASLREKNMLSHNESVQKEDTIVHSDIKAPIPLKKEDDIIEKENQSSLNNEESPPLSARIQEVSNYLKSVCSLTPAPQNTITPYRGQTTYDCVEFKTPVVEHNPIAKENRVLQRFESPREMFKTRSSGIKHSLVEDTLQFLNSASREELKGIKGIGDKRATNIIELREESPEPFKTLNDLQYIGLSAKQIKTMMKNVAGELFS